MTKQKIQRTAVCAIRGDTIAQRKQQVCLLLQRLGFHVDRKQVRQTTGTLSIRFSPPFPEQVWPRLDQLSQVAAVLCIPHAERPEVERIEAVFEREPGWYFAVPCTHSYHPMERTDLERLLPWYNQLVHTQQTAAPGQSQAEDQEEIGQPGLW